MICLDILKDKWLATQTLRTIMLSLQALLTSPEPDDPQDAVVARQYKESNTLYMQVRVFPNVGFFSELILLCHHTTQTAAYWTLVFATENSANKASTGNQFEDFEGMWITGFVLYINMVFLAKIKQLMMQRGCNKVTAINALSCNGWNVSAALKSF